MSQSDFGTINPNTKSGTQLATDLNNFRDALNSLHSGSSRPAYAGAGLLWLDTTGTPWILKLFDGTDDITLGTFNASTNVFAAAGVLASSTDNAVPRFNGTTGAIQNSGVIVDDNNGIRVPGNLKLSKGTDIASGTAITIPTDGNFFDVTGTTTIATIGTVAVGTMVTLQFDGALTLTHSTDLVLPGAANITTAAGDVATFVEYATGDWICVAYSNVFAFAGSGTGDLLRSDGDGSQLTGINSATQTQLLTGGYFSLNPWQRGTSITAASTFTNSDGNYTADQWVLLSDGNDIVDVSRDTDGSLLATVQTANKQFGFVHIVRQANARHVIGQAISAAVRAKASGLGTLRLAVLSWTGTADDPTRDVVGTWAGGGTEPTWAANWTREGTIVDLTLGAAYATAKANDIDLDTASAKQFAVFVWLDDTDGAINDTMNIQWISAVEGASHPDTPPYRVAGEERALCKKEFFIPVQGNSKFVGFGYQIDATSGVVIINTDAEIADRANLSVTVSSTAHFTFFPDSVAATAITLNTSSTSQTIALNISVASGFAANDAGALASNNASALMYFSCEM